MKPSRALLVRGAEGAHVERAAQALVADAADLAWPAHRGARAVLAGREAGEGGQALRGELGNIWRTSRFDVGQLGKQDGGGDFAKTCDGAQQREIAGEHGIGSDEAAHCVHDGLDLRVEPGNVGGDGCCDSG